jgi:putative selenate reductase
VPVIELEGGAWREVGRHLYRALKSTQIAIFADACNDCGNCDVFCPEDGGPHIEKPRFFGSLDSWRHAAPLTGFVLTMDDGGFVLRGRMPEGEFAVRHTPGSGEAQFDSGEAVVVLDWESHEVLSARQRSDQAPSPESRAPATVDLSPYLTLRLLLGAMLDPSRVHFVNAPFLE